MPEEKPFTKKDWHKAGGRCERYNEDESRQEDGFTYFAEYASEDFPRALLALDRAWAALESLTRMAEAWETDFAVLSPDSPDYDPSYKSGFAKEIVEARALLNQIGPNFNS